MFRALAPSQVSSWLPAGLSFSNAVRIAAPAVAVGPPFAAYLRTLAPTVYNIDSAEFATAAATVGLPHPPGYPL